MIMSRLKYFFAYITYHRPAAVNLVHLIIIITALVCFSYYQLQYCLYRILGFFFKLRLSKCRKVKTFFNFFFLVWLIQRGSYSKWSCLADAQYLKNKRKCIWMYLWLSPLGLSIFAFENMTKELLNLHMIWPAIIGCISEGCFCEKHKTVKCLVVPIVFQTLIFKYWFFTDYFLFSIGL